MKIGFDLDKIFIDYPPVVPEGVINWLYRHGVTDLLYPQDSAKLSYRIPKTSVERSLRKLTHVRILRPRIKENINFVRHFPHNPHPHRLYLVSGRFGFLKKTTDKLLRLYHLRDAFTSVYLNTKNEQPHKFKERMIKKLNLDLFIDDDLDLLKYLKETCPRTKLVWYNPSDKKKPVDGIASVQNLSEVRSFLPK